MTDQEAMAALFVSNEGELACHPEWIEDEQEENVLLANPDPKRWPGIHWQRIQVEEAIAAGILRLMRERDEARDLVESSCSTYYPAGWTEFIGRVNEALCRWGMMP